MPFSEPDDDGKKKMDPLYCKGDESRYIFTQGKLSLTHNALIEP